MIPPRRAALRGQHAGKITGRSEGATQWPRPRPAHDREPRIPLIDRRRQDRDDRRAEGRHDELPSRHPARFIIIHHTLVESFKPAAVAILAATELASLTETPPGPLASRALLYRLVTVEGAKPIKAIPLEEAVDAVPDDIITKLSLGPSPFTVADICPVMCALQKRRDSGGGANWHNAFRKATGLKENERFPPHQLAMQVYRELMLTRVLQKTANG